MASTRRRNLRPGSTLASLFMILAMAVFMGGAVLDAVAQQGPQLQANPTQEPTEEPLDSFQVVPTEEPDGPGGFQANPTAEPTREPQRVSPTEEPTREPIDDVVANPTEEPALDEAIPTTGTVRVEKRDCPIGIVETATLAEYLYLCPTGHNGVEFVLNDVDGAQAGVTSGGMVEWTGVDPGVFNITETLPAGYTDPIVFCGYTESPGGGVQHPSLQEATGGIVAGTFPDTMFEYVCYWMNIKATGQGIPGADDIAIEEADRTATFLLEKRICPNDIPPHQDAAYYLERCDEVVDGIPFTVSHTNGSSTKTTADGEAEWHGIPLGPFTVDEDVPVQFGEPIVFCGWTAIFDGVVYDAFSQQIPAPGGTVELEVTIPGATHFCYYFNVSGVGDLADPDSLANDLVTRKWSCPDGTLGNQPERDYYYQRCELLLEPVEFTLTTANGSDPKATQGGFVEWSGLPLGDFTLEEAIPSGYGSPTVFCGWYAFHDGYHYDAFPQLVILAAAGVIEGSIIIPNTDYFCDVFNIEGGIDDFVANPTDVPAIDDLQGNSTAGTVRLEKRDCPPGVPTNAFLADYLAICTQVHDGVEFSLETSAGTAPGTTAMGEVSWTGVASGDFEIQETIPAGYGDPVVFCGYTESPGGGVQHPAQQSAAGGLVEGVFPERTTFEYICYWMNMQTGAGFGVADDLVNAGGGGSSVVVVKKRTCPFGTPLDLDMSAYATECTGSLDGVQVTVTHANGSSTKPVIDGQAQWQALPPGPFSVQEAIPGGHGDPVITCMVIASAADGVWAYVSYVTAQPGADGLIEIDLEIPADLNPPEIAGTHTTCTYYNMPLGPGSLAQAEDLSNTFTARKWICPGDTAPSEDQDYLESTCQLSTFPVEFTLTNADGAFTQATDPAWTTWENVPLGEFSLQETIPDGYQEPIVFCNWTAFYNGMVYDDFPHIVPSSGGLVEGEITIPNTSYACDVYNIGGDAGLGGPDSVTANPPDESNTLVAHKWFCPEGTAADAHLLDYVDLCQLATEPVEFTLTNDDGASPQATAGGTAQWDNVALGQFTLKETIPAGYEVLVVWCGWTAFYNGAVYDAFSQPQESQDGLVIGDISVPNTHYRCDFINAPVVIDDFQANPTEVPAIDDVTANPPGTESPWFRADASVCPAGFDLGGSWMDVFQACTTPIAGVSFTFTDASGSSTQALTGEYVQWDQAGIGDGQTVELVEDFPAGYSDPYVLCSSWPMEAGDPFDWYYEPIEATGGAISVTPNLDGGQGPLGLIPQGEGYDCTFFHFAEETIDDVTANPPGTGTLIVHAWICPPAYDPLAGNALVDCTEAHDGVTFDLVNHAAGGPDVQATTGDTVAGTAVFEPQSGTCSLIEQIPDGFGEPFLWNCSGLSIEGLAPPISTINFFRIVMDSGQVIECDWMNVPLEAGFGGPDDIIANPTESGEIDDLQANPTEVPSAQLPGGDDNATLVPARIYIQEYICDPNWDPYGQDQWGWFHFLNGCSGPAPGDWQTHSFDYTVEDGAGFVASVTNPNDTGANPIVVPLGAIAISSTVPDGFGDPVTMCTDTEYTPVAFQPPPEAQQWGTGASLTIDVALGDSKVCQFFHVVEQSQTNAVRVNAWLCPEGTASGQDLATTLAACTEQHNDLEFVMFTWNAGPPRYASTASGVAHFADTALGTLWVEPDLPAGLATLEVYCGIATVPGGEIQDPQPQTLTVSGQVRGFLEVPGAEFACHWFSLPTGGGGANGPDDFTSRSGHVHGRRFDVVA